MENTDYYAILGVSPAAADEVIRAAFRALVQNAMDDQPRFAALNEAFDTLKDPEKRAAYDAARAGAERTAMPVAGNATMQMPAGTNSPIIGGQGVNPTVLGYLEGAPCPVCKTVGPPDDGFCQECGLMLGATVGKQPAAAKFPMLRDASGRELPLKMGANLVGREGADVMLPDASVSRRHATLIVSEGNRVTLEDLGSTNGTRAVGNPIVAGQKVTLIDGAALKFGSVALTISIPEGGGARLALPARPADKTAMPVAAIAAASTAGSAKLVAPDGRTHALAGASTVFGRKATSDVILTGDAFVSGTHARIVREGGAYKVVDLGSTNGTKVNGQRLAPETPVALADGDAVQFGQTAFTFRMAPIP